MFSKYFNFYFIFVRLVYNRIFPQTRKMDEK